jgi:hypothetical protein
LRSCFYQQFFPAGTLVVSVDAILVADAVSDAAGFFSFVSTKKYNVPRLSNFGFGKTS